MSTFEDSILYPEPQAEVTKPAPDFTAPAVLDGEITKVSLSDYRGKYVILFFYPKDFTFVCPTEIIAFSDRAEEFEKLNCQLIAASTDTEECHLAWIKTPRRKGGLGRMKIPILADTTKEIAARYGVLLHEAGIALRGLFIINPEGHIEHITINNLGIGRSVDETLRTLQAVQFVAEHGEVCPADWKPGSKTMQADAEGSLDYFESASSKDDDDEWGTKIQSVQSEKDFKDVTSKGKVVVEGYAPWCGKCRQITPYVEQLQEQHPGVKFVKLDTTAEPLEKLAASLGIKALPSFRFYQDGQPVGEEVTGYKKRLLGDAVDKLANQ
ncbi:hypothetical protein WJX72_009185 [[Myrmecia] bisecta]|uniref:thioredoxin-dependent peroxiredoxin n=1 Tax=[Myrmecia] bisecta TaxID=41462 RepID=A0AAW1R9H3_9CHLO